MVDDTNIGGRSLWMLPTCLLEALIWHKVEWAHPVALNPVVSVIIISSEGHVEVFEGFIGEILSGDWWSWMI